MSLKSLSKAEKKAFLDAAQYVIETDKLVSDEERKRMALYREELGIPEDEYTPGSGGLSDAIDILAGLSLAARAEIFAELEALAQCDMDYHSSERIVINALRDMLELD